ncbi:hypothetical protein PAXRUDRAFT_14152 [Paxillus rubicundulus Ve08.2h10]|uniref:Uncharacterized protein n=1 Tax=Paxillus rubicundulus Ve08.2h10 TaxID=930991 RepID=A0A0D0DX09_9AGAM|nr:hypothetical protein PAXRUDRAFT_14152 [Paxillus rubicundulus Ve08.2h10]
MLDNPYFPWPSKAHFLTSLLFSSAHLPFSRTQKAAILNWAKELGASDVPTLYSFQKVTDSICEVIGNPSWKVTSSSGNVFYINDIAKAITKDYGNLLTRLAMQDYPEDKGKGMLQDTSGDYFIPEHFFSAASNQSEVCSSNKTIPKTLYALGWSAKRTPDGFIVHDEQEMVLTSIFEHNFEDISSTPGELECGLTGEDIIYTFQLNTHWFSE